MLTEVGNKYNWFATLDKGNPNNGFIHTADWDMFLSCPKQFPIAYEVMALLLHRFSFDAQKPITEQAHARAIGCVSDLCMEKKDIILKMRTADVCGDCMTKLKQRMPMPDIMHALKIMDSLRVKMLYAQNFKQHVSFRPEIGTLITELVPGRHLEPCGQTRRIGVRDVDHEGERIGGVVGEAGPRRTRDDELPRRNRNRRDRSD